MKKKIFTAKSAPGQIQSFETLTRNGKQYVAYSFHKKDNPFNCDLEPEYAEQVIEQIILRGWILSK